MNFKDIEDVKLKQFDDKGIKQSDRTIISKGDDLFECTVAESRGLQSALIKKYLNMYR